MSIVHDYSIAHVFKRSGMYFGEPFETLREFHIFLMTLWIVRDDGLPEEESLAAKSLPRFVVWHLYGSLENRNWMDELLRVSEDDWSAIMAGMIIILELAEMIRSRGVDKLDEILKGAPDFELVSSPKRSKRLDELIEDAISVHQRRQGDDDFCRLD